MAGAPYSDSTYTFRPQPIADIKFSHGDDYLVYTPLEDITNIELANMMKLFTVATLQSGNGSLHLYDFPEFIKRKQLMRHFTKEPK